MSFWALNTWSRWRLTCQCSLWCYTPSNLSNLGHGKAQLCPISLENWTSTPSQAASGVTHSNSRQHWLQAPKQLPFSLSSWWQPGVHSPTAGTPASYFEAGPSTFSCMTWDSALNWRQNHQAILFSICFSDDGECFTDLIFNFYLE